MSRRQRGATSQSPDRTTPTPYASRVTSSSSSGARDEAAPVLDRTQLMRALSDAGRELFVRSLSSQSSEGAAELAAPSSVLATASVGGGALRPTLSGDSFTGETGVASLSGLRGPGDDYDMGGEQSTGKTAAGGTSFPACESRESGERGR